jgi:hypothetical protein
MSKTIKIPVDNAEKMILKHQFLLKEALAAAAYHQEQVDVLSKAVKDVTFMLTESTQALPGTDGGDISEPASSAPTAIDPKDDSPVEVVKKQDLVAALSSFEEKHGKFDIDTNVIAEFLMAK